MAIYLGAIETFYTTPLPVSEDELLIFIYIYLSRALLSNRHPSTCLMRRTFPWMLCIEIPRRQTISLEMRRVAHVFRIRTHCAGNLVLPNRWWVSLWQQSIETNHQKNPLHCAKKIQYNTQLKPQSKHTLCLRKYYTALASRHLPFDCETNCLSIHRASGFDEYAQCVVTYT